MGSISLHGAGARTGWRGWGFKRRRGGAAGSKREKKEEAPAHKDYGTPERQVVFVRAGDRAVPDERQKLVVDHTTKLLHFTHSSLVSSL